MTTWYFDSANGSDGNNGTSPSTPKKNYDAFTFASATPGDTYLFKRGTTQTIVTPYKDARSGASNTFRTRYGAYGEAQVPYSIWINPSAVGNMILNVSGRSYIDFEDMYFDGQAVCLYSLYMLSSGATPCNGHRVARCYFTNMAITGSGLVIGATATSTGESTDYLIEDSHFFRNPTHGMLVNGANGVVVRRCKFYGNGFNAAAGGHGFSAKFRRTDATSGWTNPTGRIWQRPLASYESEVYYVKTKVSGFQRLFRTGGTQTMPGIGEYGVGGGALYINLNSTSNPSSQGINYAWGRCYNIVVEDCESYENIWDTTAPDHEGHGFAFDDYTELSIFRRNKSHDNQGSGFSVNRGDNNTLESNIAYGNWLAGMSAAACYGTTVKHNTFFDNNQGRGAYDGDIVFFTYAKNGVISNNILSGRRAYGVYVDSTCTGFSGRNNNTYGYSAPERRSALTGTITDNPLLDARYRPQAGAIKRAGAYVGGRDFSGKTFHNPPSIGAVDAAAEPPARYLFVRT
jgi:parallel beta-helix repeat protein